MTTPSNNTVEEPDIEVQSLACHFLSDENLVDSMLMNTTRLSGGSSSLTHIPIQGGIFFNTFSSK
jgi:hypothetical protein